MYAFFRAKSSRCLSTCWKYDKNYEKNHVEEWPGDETWGIGEKLGLETGGGEGELRASRLPDDGFLCACWEWPAGLIFC